MHLPMSPPSQSARDPLPAAPASITQFTISACRDCLVDRIRARIAAKNFDELNAQFSTQDLSDLLPRAEFLAFLDSAAAQLVDANPRRYTRCPKCACPLEIENHTWSSKEEALLVGGLVGLDRTPLDDAAKQFFVANRFLCRGCRADFCRACKAIPFHTGLSCAEFVEYQSAPHCRFCQIVVTAKNRIRDAGAGRAFAEVCSGAECAEKVAQSCAVIKRCGHPCPGARDELDCPPCMFPDCEERDPKAECRDDTCSICYTEELGQAPVLKLTCGHIFHLGQFFTSRFSLLWLRGLAG